MFFSLIICSVHFYFVFVKFNALILCVVDVIDEMVDVFFEASRGCIKKDIDYFIYDVDNVNHIVVGPVFLIFLFGVAVF